MQRCTYILNVMDSVSHNDPLALLRKHKTISVDIITLHKTDFPTQYTCVVFQSISKHS